MTARGGFLLGVSLGLVFVPCAGPVLAAITVVAANNDVGWRAILLTLAYALGARRADARDRALGQRASERTRWFRVHSRQVRLALGVVIAVVDARDRVQRRPAASRPRCPATPRRSRSRVEESRAGEARARAG